MNLSRSFLFALTGTLVCLAIAPSQALAQSNTGSRSREIFYNGNIDACELTDTAVFTIDRHVRVQQFDVSGIGGSIARRLSPTAFHRTARRCATVSSFAVAAT